MPYASLEQKKNELIRKAKDGSVFLAASTATGISYITTGTTADLAPLPTGYGDLGWTTTDGSTFGRTTTQSDIESFGSVEPTRSDVTKDTVTLAVVCQETKLSTIGLYTGIDTTTLLADKTTGELAIAKPARPSPRYYRILALFVDDGDAGEIYFGRYMPRAKVTSFTEQKYGSADAAIEYGVTLTGYEDSTAGFSHKWFWGGPGWKALLTDMSIIQAT